VKEGSVIFYHLHLATNS